jgi:hypothetical protein
MQESKNSITGIAEKGRCQEPKAGCFRKEKHRSFFMPKREEMDIRRDTYIYHAGSEVRSGTQDGAPLFLEIFWTCKKKSPAGILEA